MSSSPNSFARYQKCCKALPKYVLAETRMHRIETILKLFQIVSEPIFCWILLKIFWHVSKMCLSWKSIASYSNFSETFSNFVLAEIQLHRAEKNVRHFQVFLSRNPIASYLKYPKTSFTCVPVESRLHTNETVFKHFQIVC